MVAKSDKVNQVLRAMSMISRIKATHGGVAVILSPGMELKGIVLNSSFKGHAGFLHSHQTAVCIHANMPPLSLA